MRLVANLGVTWDKQNWHIKANGYNVNDEVYWRARSSDTSPGLGIGDAVGTAGRSR